MSAVEPLDRQSTGRLGTCLRAGGVALFPTDTVYGLGVDPDAPAAIERMYGLKGRAQERPGAVMFFSLQAALAALGKTGPRVRAALEALLPGPVTLLLENSRGRFAHACTADPDTLGLRVPRLDGALAALAAITVPMLQTSANVTGQPPPRSIEQVPYTIIDRVDLALDAGELAGVASSVIDLRSLERDGSWRLLRQGPLDRDAIARLLR